MWRLYFDACVLNRLSDDRSQKRVFDEAEAIEHIFRMLLDRQAEWISSSVLEYEIRQNPDTLKRDDAISLLGMARSHVGVSDEARNRAAELIEAHFHAMDATHLAIAEELGVDVFLTTDDRMVRRAARGGIRLRIRVMNPLDWFREVTDGSG